MKSLSKLATIAFFMTLSSFAHAFVGVGPQLKCRDMAMGIPEQKIWVQVFAPSQENPYARVLVVKSDLNRGQQTLFDANVVETSEVRAKTYEGYGLNMKLAETAQGEVEGVVALQENSGADVQSYTVNCQVIYSLMKKPAPPIDQL